MPMAVLTNKPVGASPGFCKGWALAQNFRIIYGGHKFLNARSRIHGVETICAKFGTEPAQAMGGR